jgi:lysophospholipase L1-like esterase
MAAKKSAKKSAKQPARAFVQKLAKRSEEDSTMGSPAADVGRTLAKRALTARRRALRQANATIAATRSLYSVSAAKLQPVDAVVTRTRRLLTTDESAGVLIAEGDSWFDYRGRDILRVLEDFYKFEIESDAHHGDRIEEMAYGEENLGRVIRMIERVIRRGGPLPRAILLSGGGNDLAGSSFEMLVNHINAPTSGVSKDILRGVIDVRIREAYDCLIAAISEVCRAMLGNPLPIIVHGYDYPVPDGRGYLGGWWILPGPWLKPGFSQKGYNSLPRRSAEMVAVIDQFNDMLASLTSEAHNSHVHYVNLRRTLSRAPDAYQDSWENELHPSETGFRAVAAKIAAAIP